MRRTRTKATPPLLRRDFGGGGLRSCALDVTIRTTVRPMIWAWTLAPSLPWPYGVVDHAGRLLRPVRGTRFRRFGLPHCPATEVTPPGEAEPTRTIVYLHGGAFLVGGNHLHRQMLSRIAARNDARIIAPEYRKLPRHAVTDALEDAVDAYRHVLDSGADPASTVIMGDSAGGFLSIMLAVTLQRSGMPMPAGIVAMSPLVDFAPGEPFSGCAVFPKAAITRFRGIAARTQRRKGLGRGPIESPMHQHREDLPPLLVQVSSAESLYADCVRLAEAFAADGVPVELQVWDHQAHVFQAAAGILPEAAEALENVGLFVDQVLGSASGARAAS